MKKKLITIAGCEVGIAYCFATEISFRKFTGSNFDEADMTNPENIIYAILSAVMSYYHGREEEAPVSDEKMMYEATPKELIAAMEAVFQIRKAWYEIPNGEPVEKTEGDEPKNA